MANISPTITTSKTTSSAIVSYPISEGVEGIYFNYSTEIDSCGDFWAELKDTIALGVVLGMTIIFAALIVTM